MMDVNATHPTSDRQSLILTGLSKTLWLRKPRLKSHLAFLCFSVATTSSLWPTISMAQESIRTPVIPAFEEGPTAPRLRTKPEIEANEKLTKSNHPRLQDLIELTAANGEPELVEAAPASFPALIAENQALAPIPPAPNEPVPVEIPAWTPWQSFPADGGEDPRYRSSRLSSVYVMCPSCGHGCCRCVYAPFGDSLHSAFSRQIRNGSSALLTVYNYDFYPMTSSQRGQLTSRGIYQLEQIVERAQFTPASIFVQATGDTLLDESRKASVIEALADLGVPSERVKLVRMQKSFAIPASGPESLPSIQSPGWTLQSSSSGTTFGGAGNRR